MRIAIDCQTFCHQTYGGISRYFVRLAQGLLASGQDAKVFAPLHRNSYVAELPPTSVSGRQLPYFPPGTTRLFVLLNQRIANPRMRAWKPDLVHETYYSGGARRRYDSFPRVLSVFDMIHELFPLNFPRRDQTSKRKRDSVNRADHIICISHTTRNDLIRLFGTPEERVSVVHLGFETFPSQASQASVTNFLGGCGAPFVLYVGNRGGYKNFYGLLRAFAASERLMANFGIVAFGGGPFSGRERTAIDDAGFRPGQVRHYMGSDEVLGALYDQARAFVYPSLYEGFGLPPLEAMAHRCPVVCSNASSIPEVAGDAAEYFDPTSLESIGDALERVLYSASAAEALVRRGVERLNHFSWQRCADETLAIYHRLGR